MDGISVILPVYNAEEYLARCINSLLHQTFTHFEILAIDDGSTDGSLKILRQYAETDSRLKVISQKNEGVSATRNKGLQLARQKWIAFCDADDEVFPNWLEIMEKNINNVDFVATGIHFFANNGDEYDKTPKDTEVKNADSPADLIDELISSNVFGFTWCKLFRRDIIIENGIYFNTRISFREDELWCVTYFEHIHSWRTIPYAGYKYYVPQPKKSYRGHFTDFINPIFEAYRRIFPTKLTPTISAFYYKIVRDMLAQSVANGIRPGKELTDNFSMILQTYAKKRTIVTKCVDYMLVRNNKLFAPLQILLKAHKR